MLFGLLIFILQFWAVGFITWVMYLAAMNLKPRRHELKPIAKVHGYILLGFGLAFDVAINVMSSLLFLKHPQDWLLTGRLRRYLKDPNEKAWRKKLAKWICAHLLDQFDPSGCHCGDCDDTSEEE